MAKTQATRPDDGIPVRAISRAFEILQMIIRRGNPTIKEVKDDTALAYATVYRIITTLEHDGLIESDAQKHYRPIELVSFLTAGPPLNDQLVSIARPIMENFASRNHWPVAIFVRAGNRMVVKHSSSTMGTQTLKGYYPGYTLPLIECATGDVYRAYCSADEFEVIQKTIQKVSGVKEEWNDSLFPRGDEFTAVWDDGFATRDQICGNNTSRKSSEISAPVLVGGIAIGALTMVSFDETIPMADEFAKCATSLLQTAEQISKALESC